MQATEHSVGGDRWLNGRFGTRLRRLLFGMAALWASAGLVLLGTGLLENPLGGTALDVSLGYSYTRAVGERREP